MSVFVLLLIAATILAFLGAFGVSGGRVDLFRLGVAIALLALVLNTGVAAG